MALYALVAGPTTDWTPRIRLVLGVMPAIAAAFLVWIALAPTAQAAYVEFGSVNGSTTDQTVDIEMNGHSISIIDETRTVTVDAGEYGFRMNLDFHVKTIRFNSGPVMLSSVEFDNPMGQATISGPDGVARVLAGETVNRYISSVQTVGFYTAIVGDTAGASLGGVNVDLVQPVSAIPEPNAAVLFAAGVGLVGMTTKRRR